MKMTEKQERWIEKTLAELEQEGIGGSARRAIDMWYRNEIAALPEPAPDKGDVFCDAGKVLAEAFGKAITGLQKALESAVEKIQAAKPDPSPFPVSLSQAILYDFDGVAVPGIISGGLCIFSPKINTAPATPGKFKPFDEDKMFRPFQG